MSEKIATDKAKSKVKPTVKPAQPTGETAPIMTQAELLDNIKKLTGDELEQLKGFLDQAEDTDTEALTPRQQAALDRTRDADLDGDYLTAQSINQMSKWLAEDDEYQGAVFTLADFDELVKRGQLQMVDGEYHLTLTAMDLSPAEAAFIRATRANDWSEAGKAMSDLMHKTVKQGQPSQPTQPPVELIKFRAPDPAQPYGYDYGDSIMPHELIAMAIVYDLARFTDLPRYYTVADNERSTDFLETIIASMESAFQTIEAIELAQLIVAIQRDKSRNH